MEILRNAVILVHLVGFAILFGAWVVEATGRRRVTPLMNTGLGIALVAGLVLAAPWGITYELNYIKLGTKLVILLVIGALIGVGIGRQRRSEAVPAGVFWSIGVLTLVNAGIALIWR